MRAFSELLAVGGKSNSLGRASEVTNAVLADPTRINELFDCLYLDDAWIKMRAADSLEKICRQKPESVSPYVDTLLIDFGTSKQASIQWHMAQMFIQVDLTDRQRFEVIAWLKGILSSKEVDWIVCINAVKAVIHFYNSGYIAKKDALELCNKQLDHSSKTVRLKITALKESIR